MLNVVKHLFREAVGYSQYVVIDSSLSLRMTRFFEFKVLPLIILRHILQFALKKFIPAILLCAVCHVLGIFVVILV